MDTEQATEIQTHMAVMNQQMKSLEKRLHRLEMIIIALIGGYIAFSISVFIQIINI